jgi:hypothetical protein
MTFGQALLREQEKRKGFEGIVRREKDFQEVKGSEAVLFATHSESRQRGDLFSDIDRPSG